MELGKCDSSSGLISFGFHERRYNKKNCKCQYTTAHSTFIFIEGHCFSMSYNVIS